MIEEPQIPNAAPSCLGSWNIRRISASTDGMTVAAAMPSRARATSSISVDDEYAASRDAAMNPTAPAISTRRWPTRSPSVPIVSRKPAIMKP